MKLTMRPNSTQSGSRHHVRNQEGFLLLGVLFMILLVTFALAVAAPKMAQSIRRDKEEETIQRGKQYARAIQMYYAKYGRYPNSIDQLMKTDNVRFLRKRYLDPMTGKDDWRIIHLGEAKVPAMGLFGQQVQLQGGITPTGATNGSGSTSTSPFGSSSSFGSSGSSPGGGSSTLGSSGSSFGNSSGSSFGSSSSSFGGSSGSAFGNSGSSTSPTGGSSFGSGFGSSSGSGLVRVRAVALVQVRAVALVRLLELAERLRLAERPLTTPWDRNYRKQRRLRLTRRDSWRCTDCGSRLARQESIDQGLQEADPLQRMGICLRSHPERSPGDRRRPHQRQREHDWHKRYRQHGDRLRV